MYALFYTRVTDNIYHNNLPNINLNYFYYEIY